MAKKSANVAKKKAGKVAKKKAAKVAKKKVAKKKTAKVAKKKAAKITKKKAAKKKTAKVAKKKTAKVAKKKTAKVAKKKAATVAGKKATAKKTTATKKTATAAKTQGLEATKKKAPAAKKKDVATTAAPPPEKKKAPTRTPAPKPAVTEVPIAEPALPAPPAAEPDTPAAEPDTPAAETVTPAAKTDTPPAETDTPAAETVTPAAPAAPDERVDLLATQKFGRDPSSELQAIPDLTEEASQGLEAAFHGQPVPEPIEALHRWSLSRPNEWFSGRFEFATDGVEAAREWFGGDEETAAQFSVFGQDADGSLYAFWTYASRPIEDAPIVCLGTEGQVNLLASSPRDFLTLLTLDVADLGTGGWQRPAPMNTPGHEAYLAWVTTTYGIERPADVARIIDRARRDHQDPEPWVAARASRQPTE